MKKHLFIGFVFLTVGAFAQSNIDNGYLETWTQHGTSPNTYEQPGGSFLSTLNELADLPAMIGGPGPVTVIKTTDVHQGNYAAKLTSKQFHEIFLPGMLGTTVLDIPKQTIYLGRPYTERPYSLKGYFKYIPVNGDKGEILIMLSKWNSGTHGKDTLGFGHMIINSTVSSWTFFEIPVNYNNLTTTPDSLTILCVSSAGYDMNNLQGATGQAESSLYIDELSMLMEAGIEQPLMPEVEVNVFPNPANGILNFKLIYDNTELDLEIYSMDGKWIKTIPRVKKDVQINVSSFDNGLYYYKLSSSGIPVYTGKIIVNN